MLRNILDMHREVAAPDILIVAFKRQPDDREGQLMPGYFVFLVQPDLQAFVSRPVILSLQLRTKHHVDLVNVWNAEHAVEFQIGDLATGFFPCFTRGRLFG